MYVLLPILEADAQLAESLDARARLEQRIGELLEERERQAPVPAGRCVWPGCTSPRYEYPRRPGRYRWTCYRHAWKRAAELRPHVEAARARR